VMVQRRRIDRELTARASRDEHRELCDDLEALLDDDLVGAEVRPRRARLGGAREAHLSAPVVAAAARLRERDAADLPRRLFERRCARRLEVRTHGEAAPREPRLLLRAILDDLEHRASGAHGDDPRRRVHRCERDLLDLERHHGAVPRQRGGREDVVEGCGEAALDHEAGRAGRVGVERACGSRGSARPSPSCVRAGRRRGCRSSRPAGSRTSRAPPGQGPRRCARLATPSAARGRSG
jgi:hypothetical protein